ncbi:LOW QUALITY PROTEIN: F-box only protein 9-like [Acanthaster planci]|uniref:F-box only protein 9 n=1 Tax=Acanthaster planci TaxID=133434 RepID=A0A8B7ZHP8_ACAPL|nr:LOW QUALITY PROTEIN: F-box only protein 9-like [Acanthaster planci]
MANQEHFIRRERFQDEKEEKEEEEDPPDETRDLQEELTSFRQQWREELLASAGSVGKQDRTSAGNRVREPASPADATSTANHLPGALMDKGIRPNWSIGSVPSTSNPVPFVVVNAKLDTSDKQGNPATASVRSSGQQQLQQPEQQLSIANVATKRTTEKNEVDTTRQLNREETIETKAKELFIQGVNAERKGNLTEAICKYRHAIQLVPDVESKITDYTINQVKKEDDTENDIQEGFDDDGNEDDADRDGIEELESELNALTTNDIKSHCEPEFQQASTHISALPVELLLYIFRWVVSSDLDLRSLELLSFVCRGFYVCARDPALWHRACLSMFGANLCLTKEYISWRQMFLERPHPNFNGLYISRNTYFRKGEADDDGLYRPWHMVEYYRYVRFFPDGVMLMYSAPDEPKLIVGKLRSQTTTLQSVVVGHYRLDGDLITGVLRRENNKVYDNNLRRYIRYKRHMNTKLDTEHIFYVEFIILSCGHRPNFKLDWRSYSCHTHHRPTGRTTVTDFEVDKKFKPLIFSRVKSYTKTSESPL